MSSLAVPGRGVAASRLRALGRKVANEHTAEAKFEIVDLAEYGLPILDEPVPALFGEYQHAHTLRWAEVIGAYDGLCSSRRSTTTPSGITRPRGS